MVVKSQHISPEELLIHPGETILEIIHERKISQKELALRTGFTEKHISTVINGQKSISAEFAMKLQYALSIPASFWRNLQTNYDLEVVAFNEKHNISEAEKRIAKELKPTVEALTNLVLKVNDGANSVYTLRELLGVSSLTSLVPLNAAQYRAQFAKNTSENIMYAWQYLCEKKTEVQTTNVLDVTKLKNSLNKIKSIMHFDAADHIRLIQEVLNECGVLFVVEKHVKHAPIKGLTVKTKQGQVMIALTIRGKFVDIFWFTLFHEIGHVINGDYLKNQIDWEKNQTLEQKADEFARDTLIDKELYHKFISEQDFSLAAIAAFAKRNNILPAIVIGRLMNDGHLAWNEYRRETYSWADEA